MNRRPSGLAELDEEASQSVLANLRGIKRVSMDRAPRYQVYYALSIGCILITQRVQYADSRAPQFASMHPETGACRSLLIIAVLERLFGIFGANRVYRRTWS